MKRKHVILVSSLAIGISSLSMPPVQAAVQRCGASFTEAWKDKVNSYKAWNRKHPEYVKKHHLNRDMSRESAAEKARLREMFDIACGIMNTNWTDINYPTDIPNTDISLSVPPSPFMISERDEMPFLSSPYLSPVPEDDYPVYDNPEMGITLGGYPYVPGGWYSGGYGYPHRPHKPTKPKPPIGPSNPDKPPVPVPEPASLLLVASGLLLLAKTVKGKINNTDSDK